MNDTAKPAKPPARPRATRKAPKPAAATQASAEAAPPSSPPPSLLSTASASTAAGLPSGARALEMLSPEQRAALEQLSLNLARAAMTAQGAIAEAALRQADRPAALSPDPFHVGTAMSEVISSLAGQPDRLLRAQSDLYARYMELWRTAALG